MRMVDGGRQGNRCFAMQGRDMLTLNIGTRSFSISETQVAKEADRMFKLSAGRRAHRLERAKSQLARAGGTKAIESPEPRGAVKQAAAIILSAGVTEI
jgi:hypothetical protein